MSLNIFDKINFLNKIIIFFSNIFQRLVWMKKQQIIEFDNYRRNPARLASGQILRYWPEFGRFSQIWLNWPESDQFD
jgi:hypothetical protein